MTSSTGQQQLGLVPGGSGTDTQVLCGEDEREREILKKPANAGKKSRDREQRWDEIIQASAGVFFEKGYEGASLQDIASAVGLLKGSIYYYIDTKEDLLYELVMRVQKVWRQTIEESEELAASPAPVRLREFILRFMQLREREREWGLVAEREFRRLSPDYRAKVNAGRSEFGAFVRQMIDQGMADGDFDQAIPAEMATNMVFELVKSSHVGQRPGNRQRLTDVSDAYACMLIRGLGKSDWVAPSAK